MFINLPQPHDNLSNISLKLSCMSIKNVEWSCLHSKAGIVHSSGEKLNRGKNVFPDRVSYMKCLYKKAKPVFSKPVDPSHSDEALVWDDKSFSRLISPDSQALAILAMCSCADVLYSTDLILASSLLKSAGYYRDFSSTYMRNADGLFIPMEDKTKNFDEEPKLKPCTKNIKLSDQALMHEALVYLHNITSQKDMKEFLSPNTEQYREEAEGMFSFINESLPVLLSSSSKEISICISSFARCLNIEKEPSKLDKAKSLLYLLCAELDTRIRITGELDIGPETPDTSSMMTHIKASCAMLEGYLSTGVLKFREHGVRIYDYLEDLYNDELKLYMDSSASKVTCSIRDIADMLKLQLLKCQVDNNPGAEKRLEAMYYALVENSSIMQSLPEKSFNIGGQIISLPDQLPDTLSTGRAPVFVKSIKLNLKKDNSLKASKHFNSLYSLYASYTFLHYFLQQYSTQTLNTNSL